MSVVGFVTDAEFREWCLEATRRRFDSCTACPLHRKRCNVVHGAGAVQPLLAVVGDSADEAEDYYGEPFHGDSDAGSLFRRAAAKVGIDLEADAWLTNAVACKTPRDRTPTLEERGRCFERLSLEIQTVQPYVILCLGKTALHSVCVDLPQGDPLERHLGLVKRAHWPYMHFGSCGAANLKAVFATYSPSHLLRARGEDGQAEIVGQFGKDLRNVRRVLDKLRAKVRRAREGHDA